MSEDTKAALEAPTKKFSLAVSFASIMNVKVAHLAREISGETICYGCATTSGEMDVALLVLERAFDHLVELAEKQKQARLLATEITMTGPRVNLLRHLIIPDLHETIRFIFDKLADAERGNISRLTKTSDIMKLSLFSVSPEFR